MFKDERIESMSRIHATFPGADFGGVVSRLSLLTAATRTALKEALAIGDV